MSLWMVPIPGNRRLRRLQENIAAADLELTAEDLADLQAILEQIDVRGGRYPEQMERIAND
jgi:aryl-alcohol dehydrogenase-like predicted oxidoreductase